jgi:hypothetical protein
VPLLPQTPGPDVTSFDPDRLLVMPSTLLPDFTSFNPGYASCLLAVALIFRFALASFPLH